MVRLAALILGIGWAAASCAAPVAPAPTRPAAPVEASVRQFLQARLTGEGEARQARFHLATADLDGDGTDEALVWLEGPGLCGTGGCDLLILQRDRAGWREVTRLSITRPPIRLLASRSNGWHDLGVFVSGGGVSPGYEAVLPFDGTCYPTNPTVPPARASDGRGPGRVLITGDQPLPVFPPG